jgi:hypothetical protein
MFLSGFVFVIPHLVFCNIVWIISKMADDLLHNYMSIYLTMKKSRDTCLRSKYMSCMCILDLSALKWSGNIPYWNKSRRSHYLTTLYVWTQKKWYIVTVNSWCFRLDKTLQDLVYKLVPGLYKSEYIVSMLFMPCWNPE